MKRAFDGNNQKELFDKILSGTHPPIPEQYSQDLRHLINGLLLMDSARRPSPAQILKLGFIRKAMEEMINDESKPAVTQTQVQAPMQLPPKPIASIMPQTSSRQQGQMIRQSIQKLQLSKPLPSTRQSFSAKKAIENVEKSQPITGRIHSTDESSADDDFVQESDDESSDIFVIDDEEEKEKTPKKLLVDDDEDSFSDDFDEFVIDD